MTEDVEKLKCGTTTMSDDEKPSWEKEWDMYWDSLELDNKTSGYTTRCTEDWDDYFESLYDEDRGYKYWIK